MSADKLQFNSFSNLALRKDAEQRQLKKSASFGMGMMRSFCGGNCAQGEGSAVLARLSKLAAEKKSLKQAYGNLSATDQAELRRRVGEKNLNEILAISENRDAASFWREAAAFGARLKANDQIGAASGVLGWIAQAGPEVPADVRNQASRELDAIVGRGSTGMRAEFLIGQFSKQASDWRVIAPMIAGSAVYGLARTSVLGRLAVSEASWATRGLGAKLTSSAAGMALEVPIFALGSRALAEHSDPTRTVGQDLLGATLTLGALKVFGATGNEAWKRMHGITGAGVATRLASSAQVTRGLFTQGSMFLGMMGSHQLEVAVGLRPHVDGATAVTDTLSSMVALGVGANLGHRLLGPNFARFQSAVEERARLYTDAMGRPDSGRSIPWLNAIFPVHDGSLAMVPISGNGGRFPIATGRPALPQAPSIAMMVASDGPGGGEAPSRVTWLSLAHDKASPSLRVTEAFLPEAQRLWAQRTAEPGDSELTTVAAFLKTVLEARPGKELSEEARTALLKDAFQYFNKSFVGNNDIHAVTRGLNNQGEILTAYNRAKAELNFEHSGASALLVAAGRGEAGLFAQFGGQANSYFQELSNIYQAYPAIRDFISEVGNELKAQADTPEAQAMGFHTEGLDVARWLENPAEVPDAKYLSSSAVSQPLIGLTQLAHYYNTLKISGKTPGEMRDLLKGTTGHSQGVMSSVVVASSATEADLAANAKKAVTYLLWQGMRMQQVTPQATLNPDVVAESVKAGDGVPTQMLGLLKLTPETVKKYVDQVNKQLPKDRQIDISLINGPRAVVVSGHPESNHRLLQELHKAEAKDGQGRVPYSDRKLEFVANYFPVSAEFHSRYMDRVPALMTEDMKRLGISFGGQDLAIPVYNTFTGEDLRLSRDLTTDLILQQSIQPVYWEKATAPAHGESGVTHVIDFGPGGTAGIGAITARNKEGTGVQTVLAGGLQGTNSLLDKSFLFDSNPKSVRYAPNWGKDFGPKLVRLTDGSLMVDTPFTRLTGKPPVMAAGMTPTSANESFVTGVINAGFHGELAGGGQHTEAYFRKRVDNILAAIPAGEGITSNLLFLNAYLWNFQYPLVELMSREGKPMDGVTIAAGVPSLDNAKEILPKLREAGIRHVAFKPGNIASIKDVIEIAKENPESTVILQWTGGRGGGHHSYEDMHQPILETYAAIRRRKNLILVAGSGLGAAEDSLPYMTGEWSQSYGYPKMPFDGVLLGSRLMVAQEALTAPEAKKLLAETPGIENQADWEKSYKGDVGGIVTVISELGEPIHKVNNRGMKVWKEFDEKYFSKPIEEREAAILKDKDEIIRKINADYQKLYFGQKSDGSVADLSEMTYEEVIHRMMNLMFVLDTYPGNSPRWMDVTFRDRVHDFMVRTEERFARGKDTVALMQSPRDIERDPYEALNKLTEKYPGAKDTLLTSEDIDYFINLSKRPGKPVNFIPVIDKDLHLWFKKDSLWQSEDLEAVPGHDVQRVAILQGPVAVRYSTQADEPVGEIMGRINQGFIEALRKNYPDETAIPTVEYLGGEPVREVKGSELPGVKIRVRNINEEKETYSFQHTLSSSPDQLPDAKLWLENLAGLKPSWLRALLTTPRVVQGRNKFPNPMPRLFRPRPGQFVDIQSGPEKPLAIRVFESEAASLGENPVPALQATIDGDRISVTLNHSRPASAEGAAQVIPLTLEYRYNPKQGYSPIHEIMEGRNQRIKDFYAQLWFGEGRVGELKVDDTFTSSRVITREDINRFRNSIGNTQESFLDRGQEKLAAPLDMAILAGWEPMIKTIFPKEIDADIFRLVHLSNQFKVLDPRSLQEGDKVDTQMRILEVRNVPGGKRISVQGTLSREGRDWVELTSQFFIRGEFRDFETTFNTVQETREVTLAKSEDIAVLTSKNWLKLNDGVELKLGDRLRFEVETRENFKDEKTMARTATQGKVTRNGETIGKVDMLTLNVGGNIVHRYLDKYGVPVNAPVFFENGGYTLLAEPDTVTAPKGNQGYAIASRDFNPIHVNPYVADLAELPTTITHGMWTSANGRRVVETHVAKNHPERVVDYKATFTGMVKPGDVLSTQVKHVGMRDGRKVVEVETVNQDGATVLKANAEVAPPSTAYVFTGQGSAEVGMGMDLYENSSVAKEIWDRADRHLKESLGFSIINIVKNNPKELTLSFGGPKGAKVRQNLMALRREVVVEEAGKITRIQAPLFPEIAETSETYTFRHPEGLLFATQFTQPAITLYEMAAYADMRSKGLVPPEAYFAGHSLGEYAGLSTVGGALPVETVAEVVFLRGMTMQSAVPRDAEGFSPYRMAAVNPSRIGRWLTEDALKKVVASIAQHSGKPLEIVNFNVENQQYVTAGEAGNIDALFEVLRSIKGSSSKIGELDQIVPKVLAEVEAKRAPLAKGESIIPKGSNTVIPLPGIDVPFHSTVLREGVPAFRATLEAKMPQHLDLSHLIGKYIPNLVAKPFSLDRAYVEEVAEYTQSPVLQAALQNWESEIAEPKIFGRKLLIELLAYQFASPVRWIETQDLIFGRGVERTIEVGPAATLKVMAERTLKSGKHPALPGREILAFKSDQDALYFVGSDAGPAAGAAAPAAKAEPVPAKKVEAPKAAPPPPPPVAVVAAPLPAAGGAPVADAPVSALEALTVLLAVKLKKPVSEIKPTDSIKALVGGKSAVQNEILGDLQKEFGSGPDNAHELPLSKLAEMMGGGYSGLGKQSSAQIDKLVSTKLPGGFGKAQISTYLSAERRLGEGRTQGVLLHALSMEPPARLGSDSEAKAWLDSVVDSYGQKSGVSIPKGAAAPAAAVGVAMPMVASGPAAQPVPDKPVSAIEVLRVLLAVKLKKGFGEIGPDANIKNLVGGKSAVQNEILGDLQKEFGNGPDNSAELPLAKLAETIGGSYSQLGKVASANVAKVFSTKMPGGFGVPQAKAYLASERLLGDGRADGVLAFALTMEPPARLGSETEAKAWLDSVVDAYAGSQGISVPRASQGGGGVMMGGGGAAVDSAALQAFEARQNAMIRDVMRVYAEVLGEDPRAGELKAEAEGVLRAQAEAELAVLNDELGEPFLKGIKPMFDSRKLREYEAAWNWARQDILSLYHDLDTGRVPASHTSVVSRMNSLLGRASADLVKIAEFHAEKAKGEGKLEISLLFAELALALKGQIPKPPVYFDRHTHMAPELEITTQGEVKYREVPRKTVPSALAYAQEMAAGSDYKVEAVPEGEAQEKVAASAAELKKALDALRAMGAPAGQIAQLEAMAADLEAKATGKKRMPYLFLKRPLENDRNTHVYDPESTTAYLDALEKLAQDGVSFAGKTYLAVGAGRNSIAIEVVKNLLAGGATVITTTLFGTKQEADFFKEVYEQYGAKGSRLITLPVNQASLLDTNALVKYIYDPKEGLGLDLDGVIPFAAIPEQGMDIGNIGSKSEFAHRMMLTNVLRLLGAIKNEKQARGIDTRPALALLPMSPNHGNFGHDGLYAESKIGLEPLFNKWTSEGWSPYLSIAGAPMGWTRGTGVMAANNLVAQAMEGLGARTFSQAEMAFNLTALLHPDMIHLAQRHPIWADLNGGFSGIKNLNEASGKIRQTIEAEAKRNKAVADDNQADAELSGNRVLAERKVQPKANFDFSFPQLPSAERREALKHLRGLVDPSQVVVVTGFGEVGPYGNARTRWEMEAKGEFSLEGTIELAWMMGLIKYHNGQLKDGKPYTGWVDAKTGDPVADAKVKELYEETLLKHTGIRMVEPALFEGYDPHKKFFLREVQVTRDLVPIEVSNKEEAEAFKLQHGEKVDVYEREGQWYAQLKKGAILHVPKALRFDRFVAGQIPTGWDPAKYGVPKDIIDQVDPTTLYILVSTIEALVSAGITDPYEFYEYVHVSELGNTQGGGMGGMRSLRRGFREIFMEKPIQGDILQEQLINVMPAWINMLLLSSSGPIKTPVGACATAAESIEMGLLDIQSGKAKIVFVGGYDDFGEEGSYEFSTMQATSNSAEEVAKWRDPKEMSRPTTKTRSGFMEAQGAAGQILMSGDLAIRMGLPVRGVVGFTHTASDKQGRSVPAPGQGVLTAAKEKAGDFASPLLDPAYRKAQIDWEKEQAKQWAETQVAHFRAKADELRAHAGEAKSDAYFQEMRAHINREVERRIRAVYGHWNHEFFKGQAQIAPLRGALAIFGLDVDDVAFTSFHGTSTTANDMNESGVLHKQMAHLGRTPGNPLFVIAQKWLTGHPKGAAAGWMFNGAVQALLSGTIPGIRSADNTDAKLAQFSHLVYPNRTIQTGGVKAGLLQSFGFGQAGAQVLVIHPDYLLGALGDGEFEAYAKKRAVRETAVYRHMQETLAGKRPYMKMKDAPPYALEDEDRVLMDPTVRAVYDPAKGTWVIPSVKSAVKPGPKGGATPPPPVTPPVPVPSGNGNGRYGQTPDPSAKTRLAVTLREQAAGVGPRDPRDKGVGTDVQDIREINVGNKSFVDGNFTDLERHYALQAPDPKSTLAGLWAAKEAVIKAISDSAPEARNLWKGAGEPVKDIEIVRGPSGAPEVWFHGYASEVTRALGITEAQVTISHSGDYATAVAHVR